MLHRKPSVSWRSALLATAATILVAACGGAPPTPVVQIQTQVVKETQIVQQTVPVEVTKEVVKETQKEVVVTATPEPAQPEQSFDLRVLILCGPPVDASYNIMLASFAATHPNVTIKKECAGSGDYAQGIYTQAAAGNLPDVFFSADLFTVPFVAAGALLDMRPLAEGEKNNIFNDVYPNILALGQVPGDSGVYMVPASLDTVQVYYNQDLFTKAGVDFPKDDWTWDQWIQACQTIQQKVQNVWCINESSWWAHFVPFIRGYGGDVLSPDGRKSTLSTSESVAGLQAWGDLWTKYKIAPPPGVDLGPDPFLSQKLVTWFHIPGFMKTFREKATFKWDVVAMPKHPKGQFTGMGTYGFSIAKNTKHPQAAWDFVKSLASPAGQRIQLTNYTGVPLLKSMANDPVYQELTPPPANIKAFVKGGDIGIFPRQDYPSKCGSLYAGLVNQTLNAMLESIQRGKQTAQDAATQADATIQKCLDENAK
jgi:multiple sugar transport system substrate-binding protein